MIISAFELTDPTPSPNNFFGRHVAVLNNGNIAVSSPNDSSFALGGGAVHLFNPFTQLLVTSIYGDSGDQLTLSGSIEALPNGNFVIVSPDSSKNELNSVGSVLLVDGETGIQIGQAITGDDERDRLGSPSGITILENSNFVISSAIDDENGTENVGSVKLINGNTGVQIGADIIGDDENDSIGSDGVYALQNGNFVIASPFDDINGMANAGSVILVDGITGAPINTITGNNVNDEFGAHGVTPLPNSNFVIPAAVDDFGGIMNSGSIWLIDGGSGAQIGATVAGDINDDELGADGVTVLSNGNFVVASSNDDENGIVDAGSVRLFSGSSGLPIGSPITGDAIADRLGFDGVTALVNNHFVIASSRDEVNGIESGSVMLANGVTGLPIGNAIAGDVDGDLLGVEITALSNNHFVIRAREDDDNGLIDVGSVILVNGSTGAEINRLVGDDASNKLGFAGVFSLPNSNYVVVSPFDDIAGLINAGSARLIDGSTGTQIGSPITGDVIGDQIGNLGVAVFPNSNFGVLSGKDDENGIIDAGSLILASGEAGETQIVVIAGLASEDISSPSLVINANLVVSDADNYFIFSLPGADNNGLLNSGRVLLKTF